jgi:hypothetical protein
MPTQQIQVFFPQFCDPEFSKISRIVTRTIKNSQKNWEIGENGPNLWKKKKHYPTLVYTVTPFITTPLVTTFFGWHHRICDLNMWFTFHINFYKIVTIGPKKKKKSFLC